MTLVGFPPSCYNNYEMGRWEMQLRDVMEMVET